MLARFILVALKIMFLNEPPDELRIRIFNAKSAYKLLKGLSGFFSKCWSYSVERVDEGG